MPCSRAAGHGWVWMAVGRRAQLPEIPDTHRLEAVKHRACFIVSFPLSRASVRAPSARSLPTHLPSQVSPPLRARTASARAASAGDVEVFSPAEPREAKPAAGRGSAGVAKPARGKGRLAAPARARLGVVPAAAAQPKPDRSPRAPPVWTVPVPRRPRSRLLRVPRTSAPRFLADLEGRADPAPADYAPPAPAARSRAQAGPPSAQARPVASKGKRGRLPGQRQATSPAAPPASRPRGPAPLPAGPVASLPDVASLPGTLSVPAAHAPRPTAFPAVDLPAPGPSDPAAWAPFAPFPQGAFPAPGAHPMFGDVGDHLETDSGALLAAPVDVMDDLGEGFCGSEAAPLRVG